MKTIIDFFDKFEDDTRAALSKRPVIYAFIGGTTIVLFWRGIWMIADSIPFLTGPVSVAISTVVLLATGLFVSFFVGDTIIISGLKKEKKLDEKVASEIKTEIDLSIMGLNILTDIQMRIVEIEKELKAQKNKD